MPYVAWFTYKWTITLREKSLLHVKPGAVSLLVKKGLHRISSCTLPIRLEENSKCTIQIVSGRKRPDYLKCTCCDPPQWVSVSNRGQRICFAFQVFIFQIFSSCVLQMEYVVVICCHVSNLYPLPGPHLHDHSMCECSLFPKPLLCPNKLTS